MPHCWKHSKSEWTQLWATRCRWRCALQGRWTKWDLKVLFNQNHSVKCWCLHISLCPWEVAKDSSGWVLRSNIGSWKIWSSYQESSAGRERKAGVEMMELLRKGERGLGRRAQGSIEREALFTHRAAGTELKSPDQEPGREAPTSGLQTYRVCAARWDVGTLLTGS